jgi:hypothetical protein
MGNRPLGGLSLLLSPLVASQGLPGERRPVPLALSLAMEGSLSEETQPSPLPARFPFRSVDDPGPRFEGDVEVPMRRTTWIVFVLGLVALLAMPSTGLAAIKIKRINFDPAGSDTGNNSHLNRNTWSLATPATRGASCAGGGSSIKAAYTPFVSHASSCAPIAP